jgi:hypothetical protein
LTGSYIDTLNPIPVGSEVRLRLHHNDEVFAAMGCLVYVSYALEMGVTFTKVTKKKSNVWSGGWRIATRSSDPG